VVPEAAGRDIGEVVGRTATKRTPPPATSSGRTIIGRCFADCVLFLELGCWASTLDDCTPSLPELMVSRHRPIQKA